MEAKKQYRIRVILVDDNAIFRTIFGHMLTHFPDFPIEIHTFENALEFLDIFTIKDSVSVEPDLLFVDINMPFMTGWELMDKLELEAFHFLKFAGVYIISSSASKSDREQTANYSFVDGYLLKPIHKSDLFEIIRRHGNLNKNPGQQL